MIDTAVHNTGSQTIMPPARAEDIVFYDGTCGLCHAAVRFILRHEGPASARPQFAPLFGETFDQLVKPNVSSPVPDSVHVLTPDGRLLNRSRAVLHLCRRLGGGWATLAGVASWCPTVLLNVVYRGVAATRRIILKPPGAACPIADARDRDRFLP